MGLPERAAAAMYKGSSTTVPTGALHRVTAGLRRRPPQNPSESEPDSAKEDVRRRWKQRSLSSVEADCGSSGGGYRSGSTSNELVFTGARQLQPQREDRPRPRRAGMPSTLVEIVLDLLFFLWKYNILFISKKK